MKTKLIPLIVTVLAIPASQAATTFNFDNIRFNQNGSVQGAGNSFTHDSNDLAASGLADSVTATYTLTSDFDADGIDDTLTFELTATAVAPDGAQVSVNGAGVAGIAGPGSNFLFAAGQGANYTFSIGSLVASSGGDFEATFDGFTGGGIGSLDLADPADPASVDDSFNVNGVLLSSGSFELASPSDEVLFNGVTGDVFVSGLDFDITVEAVPEPSSTALLGLGALGFLARRRR